MTRVRKSARPHTFVAVARKRDMRWDGVDVRVQHDVWTVPAARTVTLREDVPGIVHGYLDVCRFEGFDEQCSHLVGDSCEGVFTAVSRNEIGSKSATLIESRLQIEAACIRDAHVAAELAFDRSGERRGSVADRHEKFAAGW